MKFTYSTMGEIVGHVGGPHEGATEEFVREALTKLREIDREYAEAASAEVQARAMRDRMVEAAMTELRADPDFQLAEATLTEASAIVRSAAARGSYLRAAWQETFEAFAVKRLGPGNAGVWRCSAGAIELIRNLPQQITVDGKKILRHSWNTVIVKASAGVN